MDKYIIILNGGMGRPVFLVDENDEACLFDNRSDAINNAEKNPIGQARGYKIFTWDSFEG